MSPVRVLAEQTLAEPPPSCPRAPYRPEGPPSWMVSPVPVLNGSGTPVAWTDEQPWREWESRVGAAAYELQREDERDRLREAAEGRVAQPWTGYEAHDPLAKTNAVVNHLRNRLTAQQRAQRGLVRPWNRTAPPKKAEEELPEAQCSFTPVGWWE
ncbi:hypothetical protein ACFCYC_42450 [Streptomyces sp. NPDC056402]|uniref:hypothetical protein n=1 Tax=Streptomyces sp. NPDC056402 TaxID=3345810 RepID=UPI0035D72F05